MKLPGEIVDLVSLFPVFPCHLPRTGIFTKPPGKSIKAALHLDVALISQPTSQLTFKMGRSPSKWKTRAKSIKLTLHINSY